jgi:hypothetical protein
MKSIKFQQNKHAVIIRDTVCSVDDVKYQLALLAYLLLK